MREGKNNLSREVCRTLKCFQNVRFTKDLMYLIEQQYLTMQIPEI